MRTFLYSDTDKIYSKVLVFTSFSGGVGTKSREYILQLDLPKFALLLVSHTLHVLNVSHLKIDKTAGPDDLKFVFYCLSEQQMCLLHKFFQP